MKFIKKIKLKINSISISSTSEVDKNGICW